MFTHSIQELNTDTHHHHLCMLEASECEHINTTFMRLADVFIQGDFNLQSIFLSVCVLRGDFTHNL